MLQSTYKETYEDYTRDCLRDQFHEDHPRKAANLLTELAKYRDPIVKENRVMRRNGSRTMYPSDGEDIQGCLPQVLKAIAQLESPPAPRPIPDLGKVGSVYPISALRVQS